MKQCPKCKTNYVDPTLEFCLEDGVRLVFLERLRNDSPTVSIPIKPHPITAANTVEFPSAAPAKHAPEVEIKKANLEENIYSTNSGIEKTLTETGKRILELAPITISLAHNWWQWVYLNNQYYSSFSSYVFSANFLMWLFLLVAGTVVSLLALKRLGNKSFAIASLVVLAINLLLFIVPRR